MVIEITKDNIFEVAGILNENLLKEVLFVYTREVLENGEFVKKQFKTKDIPISFRKNFKSNGNFGFVTVLVVETFDGSYSIDELDRIEI